MKKAVGSFALFGGPKVFDSIRSTSNLVTPDFGRFLEYSKLIYRQPAASGRAPLERLLNDRLAKFHGTTHCVSFCSGFWALVCAIRLLAIPGKHEVVMPALTYRRLADIVAWAGLVPHFCEVDEHRLCITAETARACINANTALLLGVHPIVNCCDVNGLEQLSAMEGIPLLFDSVESVYESLDGRKIGSFGIAECFSFHASKLVNGFEGGYVTTNDAALAAELERMLDPDGPPPAHVSAINARQIEVHAAMALAGLDELDDHVQSNRRKYDRYKAGLASVSGLRLLQFDESQRNGYKNIVVELLDDWPMTRELTLAHLHGENMLCRPYYWPPLHQKATGYSVVWDDLRRTERLSMRFVNLPCGAFVSEADVDTICEFLSDLSTHGPELARRGLARQ